MTNEPTPETPTATPDDDTADFPAIDPDEAMPVDDSVSPEVPVLDETSVPPVESPETDTTGPTVPGDGSDSVEGVETPGGTEPGSVTLDQVNDDLTVDAPEVNDAGSGVTPTSGDAADTVAVPSNDPPGAATPTVQVLAPEDDPDGATFAAATGDNSEDGVTGDAAAPPDEAVFGSSTGHRDHEVDESVTDNTPIPTGAGDGGLDEWNELKNMVAEIHSFMTDLSELVEAARPAIQKVTTEVQEKGLMGLIAALMSNR